MSPLPSGAPFIKMSGSGNDFIFFDARDGQAERFATANVIERLCARGTGIGADGVVMLDPSSRAAFGIRYYNADGTLASLCGNATLCAARLAVALGIVSPQQAEHGFHFETGVGIIEARVRDAALPEIELAEPHGLMEALPAGVGAEAGERRAGFVEVGVPHVVILCDDVEEAPVLRRGRALRQHPAFPHGANVNFVSRTPEGWRYRTYERGVENETLACGTGAAAVALLLDRWGEAESPMQLRTSSGELLEVAAPEAAGKPVRLRGPARIVFTGQVGEL